MSPSVVLMQDHNCCLFRSRFLPSRKRFFLHTVSVGYSHHCCAIWDAVGEDDAFIILERGHHPLLCTGNSAKLRWREVATLPLLLLAFGFGVERQRPLSFIMTIAEAKPLFMPLPLDKITQSRAFAENKQLHTAHRR